MIWIERIRWAIKGLLLRLRFLFRKVRAEGEMEEEIQFHLEQEFQKNLRLGMGPEVARREALLAFGGVDRFKEKVRDAQGVRPIHDLVQDLRYAVRSFRRSPGFTVLAVLSLCIGIGANTTIFPALNAFFFKPLGFDEPEALFHLSGIDIEDGMPGARLSWDEVNGLRNGAATLDGIAAYTMGSGMVLSGTEVPLFLAGATVSSNLFQVLRINVSMGRAFFPSDEEPVGSPVALISDGLWRRAFGEDPEIIGRIVKIDGVARTVVGVVPAKREFPELLDLWIPFQEGSGEDIHRRSFEVVVRISKGLGVNSARAEIESLMTGLERRRPVEGFRIRPDLQPLRDVFIEAPKTPVLAMFVLTLILLFIACLNVGTLLFTRGADRAQEIAVRASIGAGRGRIIRQLLAESCVLATLGAVPGLALGALGQKFLMHNVPIQFPGFIDFGLDPMAGVGITSIVLGAGILAGMWPALQGSRADPVALVRGRGGADGSGLRPSRGRALLVGGQVSLTLAVLVGAGMMFKGLGNSRASELGYEPEGLLGAYLDLKNGGSDTGSDRIRFVEELKARVNRIRGVEGFTVGSRLPIRGHYYTRPYRAGADLTQSGTVEFTFLNQIGREYFDVLGTSVLEGRAFQASDELPGTPAVCVVDRAFADRHWPGEEALGKTVEIADRSDGDEAWEVAVVVGVVETARYLPPIRDPGVVFRPFAQDPGSGITLILRTNEDPMALSGDLAEMVQELKPNLPLHWMDSAEALIKARNWAPTVYAGFFNTMGLFGLLIASVGIFGLVASTVSRRTQEFGIRLAVGATPGNLRWLILREGGRVLSVAVVGGVFAGALLAQGLGGLAYGVSTFDPVVYLLALGLTLLMVLGAGLLPVLRVGRRAITRSLTRE